MIKNCDYYVSEDAEIGSNVEIGHGVIIEGNAVIESGVKIGAYSVILSNARIKSNTIIGSHCIIGHPSKRELRGVDYSYTDPKLKDLVVENPDTIIGENSIIRSGSIIYTHTKIGKNLNTGHYAIIREHITIGERCVIGSHTVLNGYSRIGKWTRINTCCVLPQSMRIGKGVFIAPLVSFSDNKMVLPGEGNQGAVIGDFVRIGIGAKILSNILISRGAVIGAGSVVTKDVPERAIVYGVPAKIYSYLKEEDLKRYINSIIKWI